MHYMSIFRRGVARSRGTPRRRGAFRALLKILDAKPEIACLNLPYKTQGHAAAMLAFARRVRRNLDM